MALALLLGTVADLDKVTLAYSNASVFRKV
jgi:hypothetical protein